MSYKGYGALTLLMVTRKVRFNCLPIMATTKKLRKTLTRKMGCLKIRLLGLLLWVLLYLTSTVTHQKRKKKFNFIITASLRGIFIISMASFIYFLMCVFILKDFEKSKWPGFL